MKVKVQYKKNKSWFTTITEIVSFRDSAHELSLEKSTSATLKSQIFARSSAAFGKSDNFRIVEVIEKKAISRSFFYLE
jgi:hypothetical protein